VSDSDSAPATLDWAKTSRDIWARRWRDTDRGLAGLSPHLLSAVLARAGERPFKAFEVGCGPGSTTLGVADACPQAVIVACDISPALAEIARYRTADYQAIRVVVGDAEEIASAEAPLDLIFSRHGVMFFADPVRAFAKLRSAARSGAAFVFSCFQDWALNPWASELACVAADGVVTAPGREPSGFAFGDPEYVRGILGSAGWGAAEPQPIDFDYVAGEGSAAIEQALSYLSDVGPAARVIESLTGNDKAEALLRMRDLIERHFDGDAVVFPAAAWIWSATSP
jgi:SAM-dependent methyltransferase